MTVPENATSVTIGKDGTVSAVIENQADPVNLGDIPLVDFINPQGLQAMGGNLFRETAASGDPQEGEAGIGKTRLSEAFLQQAAGPVLRAGLPGAGTPSRPAR